MLYQWRPYWIGTASSTRPVAPIGPLCSIRWLGNNVLGDFAVLIDSGLSVPKALIMNLISACTAFIGLIVGLEAGQNEELVPWLLAAAAGMFLYVAWISMVS